MASVPSGWRAFTLVELLVAIAIIAVLAGILLPAVAMVRERARQQEARQKVAQMAVGLETYRNLDGRHHYPLQAQLYPLPAIPVPHPLANQPQPPAQLGVLRALVDIDGAMLGGHLDPTGCLLDPWGKPYCYQLTRPAPATPAGALADWNWDAANARPLRWGTVADPAAAQPFPYLWSTGRAGVTTDAATWIYDRTR